MQQAIISVIHSMKLHQKKVHVCHIYSKGNSVPLLHTLSLCLFTAPSAPPYNVTILNTTLFTITVGWDEVPCIHRNGNIKGYRIVSSIKDTNVTYNVSGSQQRVTISYLQSDTEYSISVAAVNAAGVGNYSTITASTLKCKL